MVLIACVLACLLKDMVPSKMVYICVVNPSDLHISSWIRTFNFTRAVRNAGDQTIC